MSRVDEDVLDTIVACQNAPMMIVTTHHDGVDAGCLVGFHTQCGIDPFRWAVWISRANHTCEIVRHAETVAMHLPEGSDRSLAELFGGQTEHDVEKFERCSFTRRQGVPVLDEIRTVLLCRVVEIADVDADHLCVVVEPESASSSSGHHVPLRFVDVQDIDPGHDASD